MLAAGAGGAVLAALAVVAATRTTGGLPTAATWVAGAGVLAAAYGTGMGGYMTYGSRVGKLRTRERRLDLAQAVAP
jgi:hypothetical protein